MRRAWVVGHRGMLGRTLCRALGARGVEACWPQKRVDVGDGPAVLAAARALALAGPIAAVFNCAALTRVDDCEIDPREAERVNAEGAGHVARAAFSLGAPLVHVSTDYVFDGQATLPIVESAPCRPINAYGRSKWGGEERVVGAAAAAGGGWAAVVRTSWLFGDGEGHFVATMLRLMAERERLEVVDDQRGRPTLTADLAAAMVDLVGLGGGPRRPAGTYHFANHGEVSWHAFAQEIWEQARRRGLPLRVKVLAPATTLALARRAPRPAYSVLSTAKIESALGAAPRPFSAALGAYLDGRRPVASGGGERGACR